ncbi:patatin-like phospholipase family protein [Bacteriovoracales bacterium]|nr:patatin-like phospholipase family protein [Bacteriovoracales bacterium]
MAKNLMARFLSKNQDLKRFLTEKNDLIFFSENTYFEIIKRPNSFKKVYFKESHLPFETQELLKKRIFYSLESYLHDPIPQNVLCELFLYLMNNSEVHIEYVGRNQDKKYFSTDIKKVEGHHFLFDILQGKRNYLWKIHLSEKNFKKIKLKESFPSLKEWFKDKDSKVILSLGAGGLRAHAIPTIFKILDFLEIRDHIDEIWGCSGGALIGGYYAYGIPPLLIESIGYDFYNERHEDFIIKGSLFKSIKTFFEQPDKKNLNEYIGLVEMQKTLQKAFNQAKDKYNNDTALKLKDIPFFALVSNPLKEKVALTEEKYISSKCSSILKSAEPFESICASSSIPIIMKPIIKNYPEGKYFFFDGAFNEEIPLKLPFQKFNLEQEEHQKKKLKIFYVNLNSRIGESSLISEFFNKSNLSSIYNKMLHLDDYLDEKIENSISQLQNNPSVDIIGVDLVLNKNAFLNTNEIPYIIKKGRDHFLKEFYAIEEKLKGLS